MASIRLMNDVSTRVVDLAKRAQRTQCSIFTTFLSPAEADCAKIEAKKQAVEYHVNGGYPDAERVVVCFGEERLPYPITALQLTWAKQVAPTHSDILGAVMGLGLKRSCIGDIIIDDNCAYLFCITTMATHIQETLVSAGRAHLSISICDELPEIKPAVGIEGSCTVSSPRLDAILAHGFHLSRSKANDIIRAGLVKQCHLYTTKPDVLVREGDILSVRGYGRLLIVALGIPNKKGRIPITFQRFSKK